MHQFFHNNKIKLFLEGEIKMGLPPNPQIKLLKELIEVITEKFERQFSFNQELSPFLCLFTSTGVIKITILGEVRFIPAREHPNRKAHIRPPRRKKGRESFEEKPRFFIKVGKKITIILTSKRSLIQTPLSCKNHRQILFAIPMDEIKNLISSIRKSSVQN